MNWFIPSALNRSFTRRASLRFLGGTLLAVAGCQRRAAVSQESWSAIAQVPVTAACVVRPSQTEGPFFVDQRLNRSDIRSSTDGKLQTGTPLRLRFQVSHLNQTACVPLPGAIVDVWHCNAEGVYSDVEALRSGSRSTSDSGFLRGYQETAADGTAEFLTIYPGWYPGRAVHIHFKIRTSAQSEQVYEFTSQLYFDDALTDQVHAQPPYNQRGQGAIRNTEDGIFARGGSELLLAVTPADAGYAATFEIALQFT
ncbi:MAG: intradiol ring-cleavage dioxygenase [Synechococcales cyanobacterium C42_A2020_086]|jgi:protocatechuate 3,4-dioxygenase beta subunit|nr:intradiol ring-cleavage dioxygenase [Synechococcales cyanobacterium C42_A2020_086]